MLTEINFYDFKQHSYVKEWVEPFSRMLFDYINDLIDDEVIPPNQNPNDWAIEWAYGDLQDVYYEYCEEAGLTNYEEEREEFLEWLNDNTLLYCEGENIIYCPF